MKMLGAIFVMLLGTVASLSATTETTTTISSSLNPSVYGQAVTFTAVVSPNPPDGETVTLSRDRRR